MSSQSTNLEPALLLALDRAHAEYRQVEELLAALRPTFLRQDDPTQLLESLHALMQRVTHVETESARSREAWKQQKRTPSPQLQSVLSRQKGQLEGVLREVMDLERLARETRSRLAPQLDATITVSGGHAAYGRTLQRAERVRSA